MPAEARVNLLARHALRRAFAHVSTASIDTSLKSSRAFCCCYSTWISRRTRHVGLIDFSVERGISTTAHVAAPRTKSRHASHAHDAHLTAPHNPNPRWAAHVSHLSASGASKRMLTWLTSGAPTSLREPAPLRSPRASRPFGDAPRCSREPCRRLRAGCSPGARHPKNSCRGAAHVAHVADRIKRRCQA